MSEQHVIFGTGPLGKAVMRELVARGKPVRMVNRSGKADVPAGVEVVAADAYQVSEVQRVTSGSAVVYQCAQPAYTEWPEKFPPLQAAILEGTASHGAKLIIGDNLYMYGDADGKPMTEDMPQKPVAKKSITRAEMAKAALEAHRMGKARVAIGRAADFYGPEVEGSSLGERTFPNILAGKGVQGFGDLDAPHTFTYIDDFGKGLVILGERDEALGEAWHVPSAPTLSQRQILQKAYELAGVPPKISSMGKLTLRIGGLFVPEAREMLEISYQFDKPFILDHSKFARAFGDHATPHETALKTTLDWYRAHRAH